MTKSGQDEDRKRDGAGKGAAASAVNFVYFPFLFSASGCAHPSAAGPQSSTAPATPEFQYIAASTSDCASVSVFAAVALQLYRHFPHRRQIRQELIANASETLSHVKVASTWRVNKILGERHSNRWPSRCQATSK